MVDCTNYEVDLDKGARKITLMYCRQKRKNKNKEKKERKIK